MQFVPQNAILLMSLPKFNSDRSASSRCQDSGIPRVKFWSKPEKTARSFFSLVHFEDSTYRLVKTTCQLFFPYNDLRWKVSSQQERSAMEELQITVQAQE